MICRACGDQAVAFECDRCKADTSMRKGSALLATTLTAWMEQPGRAEEFGRRLMAEAAELTEQGDAREMRCAVLKAANSSRKPRSAAELALDAFDAACKG